MSGDEFQLVKIEACILKVHVNCEGCARKVKKILKKIEGVYQVSIDTEQQKVLVYGNVESTVLIGKLMKSGKHAELWKSSYGRGNLEGLTNWLLDDKKQQPHCPPYDPLLIDRGFYDLNSKKYINQGAGIQLPVGENNVHLSWDGDAITDANRESNIRSLMDFQDYANNAGSFGRNIENGGFADIQSLTGSFPHFEQYSLLFSTRNNSMTQQQYQYRVPPPSPLMMNNMQQNQQFAIPPPSPMMTVNNDIPDFFTLHSMPVYGNTYCARIGEP